MKIMSVELQHGSVRSVGLGERLKSVRVLRGLGPAELAAKLGVSRVAAVQWESQRTQPSLAMIEKISEVLEVAPEYLAFGVGEAPAPSDSSRPLLVF